MNKKEYRKEANSYCLKTLGFECFEEGDLYVIEDYLHDWWKKMTPKEFVENVFEEDFLNLEYDKHLEDESQDYYNNLDEEIY
jgi:hypothetical protein